MSITANPLARTPRQPWLDVAPELLSETDQTELSIDMARQWSLVLYARRVPHRVRQGWPGMRLLIPAGRSEEALAELRAYLRENPPAAPNIPDLRPRAASWGQLPGVLWSLSIVAIFLTMTGAEHSLGLFSVNWHGLGAGNIGLMAQGQWWRAVTALTLHADVAHLVGNLCLGGTFLLLLAGETGLGTAWFLGVAAGTVANLAKIAFQPPAYGFLGASTAVFAVLGALAGIRMVREGRHLDWRRVLPFAAGVMLLAFMGVGTEEEARKIDLAGHFMGFGAGVLLGLAYAGLERAAQRSGRPASPWLGLTAAALVVISWARALLA